MLFAGLGGSGGKLLGVVRSTRRGDLAGVLSRGEIGRLRNVETSRRSLVGVPSLIGSRAVIRLGRPTDDLGFSIVSEVDGAKRPLEIVELTECGEYMMQCIVPGRNGLWLYAPFPSTKETSESRIILQRVLVVV